MNKTLDIASKILSAVCYPLWMPTYGMALFCGAVQRTFPLPFSYWLVSVGTTFLLTGLLPLSLIWYQVKKGAIQDIYINNREERTMAYIEAAMGFAFWWYLITYILHAPSFLCGVALGATVAIVAVAVINKFWKISAHLTGMGGLLGGVMAYALAYSVFPIGLLITVCVLTLLVMYARLWLKAHTDWQVIAGLALGMACTLGASFIPLGK
ncbi:MAG: hypothetical protein KBS40_00335 [Bacteroidales bacterium]|nr:hypothetical protein [Bacteroidales bacterium]